MERRLAQMSSTFEIPIKWIRTLNILGSQAYYHFFRCPGAQVRAGTTAEQYHPGTGYLFD